MQLSFEFSEQKIIEENYWNKFFNWEPEVGKPARIDIPIAFCETLNKNAYCYMMRVKVVELSEETAKVVTTEEWESAAYGGGVNKAGNVWIVETKYLAPILKN